MTSDITIHVTLGDDKMPEDIKWTAPGGNVNDPQKAKALLLGLWDGDAKEALRIDLWTGKMMMDEMNDFYFQTFMGMADTYTMATKNSELAAELRAFAKSFLKKASDALEKA